MIQVGHCAHFCVCTPSCTEVYDLCNRGNKKQHPRENVTDSCVYSSSGFCCHPFQSRAKFKENSTFRSSFAMTYVIAKDDRKVEF